MTGDRSLTSNYSLLTSRAICSTSSATLEDGMLTVYTFDWYISLINTYYMMV